MTTDITGRDSYIIRFALTLAIEAINRLPEELRPESDRRDMETILAHYGEEAIRAQANRILDEMEGLEKSAAPAEFASLTAEQVIAQVRADHGDAKADALAALLQAEQAEGERMTILTKDEIDHYAIRIADPEREGWAEAMAEIDHLAEADQDAIRTRAAKFARALAKEAFDEIDDLAAFKAAREDLQDQHRRDALERAAGMAREDGKEALAAEIEALATARGFTLYRPEFDA